MKIEAMNPMQSSIFLNQKSNSVGILSSNGQESDADSAVIANRNQINLRTYDFGCANTADDLSEAVSNIQTLAQNGQNLDGIHKLDLERVLKLIG